MKLAGPIDLPHSLQGGQAFLWRREGDSFVGRIEGRAVVLRGDGTNVAATGAPRRAFERYFRIEPADAARRLRLARDEAIAPGLAAMPGLRLLRQDPWETTVAFLTSANNNVLRIEGILRALADADGALPAPGALARMRESTLRAAGLGYRAPFLRASARMIAKGDVDLDALRGASWDEAREALLRLPGVGPKVADCIALFSLDVDEAFPVDRWILRAASEVAGRTLRAPEAVAWARERWGADAGLAQQYLFHAVRLRAGAPGARRLSPRA
ncbi:MAG TPA: DNA glycosylase [Candidatus Thermoplasmatota archaeon]|nr:DNA glycosylase [Candidatus Thermoplasmatota archaeon]